MVRIIVSSTECELPSVIRFLQAEGNSAALIHLRVNYGTNFMSDDVVREWCRKFKHSPIDIHGEDGQGRKSFVCEDLVLQVHQVVGKRGGDDFHLFRELKIDLAGHQRRVS
ncbi:hypothetical protein AVEN_23990-1 [Araneus ventricosus]|uniref:Mos1 transposase HTH domain-containing protein n=1 Tax=Araneus ventricosus TaxID=182803 RepID=A0A4Y2CZX1_ARAVE|nr:hypothetical protein AVEN_23990-1 [Araneus ventricosus]